MLPLRMDDLEPAARVEIETLREHRADLLKAILGPTMPDPDAYVNEIFGGDWKKAVAFAVQVAAGGNRPSIPEAYTPSHRSTAGRPGPNG